MEFPVQPPPLPEKGVESARHTYLRAVGLLFPALVYLNFSALFLVPKLERIWEKAGPEITKAQWLLEVAIWLPKHLEIALPLVVLPFVFLEWLVPAFRVRRARITSLLVILVNFAVMTTLVAIPTAGFLAAPLMAKNARNSPASHADLPKKDQLLDRSSK